MKKSTIQRLAKLESSVYLDKRVLNSIEKEKSLIGKQLLILEQIKIAAKVRSQAGRNQLLALLYRLHQVNKQIEDSLKAELKSKAMTLTKRVNTGLKKKEVLNDFHANIWRLAESHFRKGNLHMQKVQHEKKATHQHASIAYQHHARAKKIYDSMLRKDSKVILKKLAHKKLSDTYKQIMDRTKLLDKIIEDLVNAIEKQSKAIRIRIKNVEKLVNEENDLLIHFATNYSKSLIHSAEFVDKLNNKAVLYEHK